MMALGPTESLVIADESADPGRLAADLLIEAEQRHDSCTVLVTTSPVLAEAVDAELPARSRRCPTSADAARCLAASTAVLCCVRHRWPSGRGRQRLRPRTPAGGVRTVDEQAVVDSLVHAGEILVGQDTPFSRPTS